MTNDLFDFDDKRVVLQKRIIICLSKYLAEKFELFPHALRKIDKLKEKEEWAKELDDLLCLRINGVISEKGHVLWEMITEEIVKVKLFYNSIREEFIEINKLGDFVIKKKREVLSFD